MRTIPLTQGKVALVDDADFERLNRHKWCAYKSHTGWYAVRNSVSQDGKRTQIQMHREILQTLTGMETDHKDHDGLNNQRSNLRMATHSENQHNRKKQKGTTSQYKGVHWNRHAARWQGRIGVKNQHIHLGYFLSQIEAAIAYDKAANQYFGKFARLNF